MKHHNGHYSHSFMRDERSDCHMCDPLTSTNIMAFMSVNKIDLANECHSSIVPMNLDIFEVIDGNMSHFKPSERCLT